MARELTGARYAAIGVLDERRERLERFLTAGIDEETHRAIGDLPRGRGVLGVLIRDPRPLRLADVGLHAQSYGFPLAHPPMTTFLGVPIVIEGEAWGNLYLTEKDGGASSPTRTRRRRSCSPTGRRSRSATRACTATVRERRDELERTIRGLETTTEISRALGGVTDLDRVLELVVKRSRALIDARAAEIALLDGDEFVIAAVAGEGVEGLEGHADAGRGVARRRARCAPAASSASTGFPTDTFAARELGAAAAIVTPMSFRNRPGRLPDRVRPARGRPAVQRGGRAAAAGLRRQRGDGGGHGAERQRRGAAAQHRGVRGRAHALGARAARRDAAAARRAARAALRGAPQRRRRAR